MAFEQLNVRVSLETSKQLDELVSRTGRTKREITEQAIDLLYKNTHAERVTTKEKVKKVATVSEATVSEASGGFGMYDCGELIICEGVESLDEWVAAAENGTGCDIEPAEEIGGKIYNQNGGLPYKAINADGEVIAHYLVFVED